MKNSKKYVKLPLIHPIIKYVTDNNAKYNLSVIDNTTVPNLLRTNARHFMDATTYDSFRKFVGTIVTNSECSRNNIYRLCYALSIDSADEANTFLSHYLGENPLSPRVMEEFIILAGYRIKLSYSEVMDIITNAVAIVNKNIAPVNIVAGETLDLAKVVNTFNSKDDLLDYLNNNPDKFAKTRNTQYFAFFPELDWSKYDKTKSPVDFVSSFYDKDDLMKIRYELFSFQNMDNINDGKLTHEEVDKLSEIFPDIFLSYDVFIKVVNRTRPEQLSTGTMLIILLNSMDPEVFEDKQNFIYQLNTNLINAGCALINDRSLFEKVILDAYDYAYEEFTKESTDDVKTTMFETVRSALRTFI